LKTPRLSDRQIIAGLITLSAIPVLAGTSRLIHLAAGATITPENSRFFAAPLPVVIHVIGASLFCLLGAFQFAPGFRQRHLRWHRIAGRILIPSGLAAAVSGLWMTQFYPLPASLQGPLLWSVRYLVGIGMVTGIVLSLLAIRNRNIPNHRAWIIRAYALGQGAGTQALTMLPWTLMVGEPRGLVRDILMSLAWVINLSIAEWIIRRK
jgi:uncharacterized membrane protein